MNIKTLYKISAMVLVAAIFVACKTYYKANYIGPSSSVKAVDSLKKNNRYFILRNGDEAFYIKNIELSTDQKTAQCTLDLLPLKHQLHLSKGRDGRMWYSTKDSLYKEVINEVHYYMPKDNTAVIGNYTLQLDKVNKIEVLEHDKKRTKSSYITGAFIATGGILVIVVIIAAITFNGNSIWGG